MTTAVMSHHKIDMQQESLRREGAGGSRILASAATFPALKRIALATIHLKKGGIREPHWHPNADEFTYCVDGKALVTLFSPQNICETMTLDKGEAVYIPKGITHHIENINDGESNFILCFSHETPEEQNFSSALCTMSAHVLASTFGVPETTFEPLLEKRHDALISWKREVTKPAHASIPSLHKINLDGTNPQIAAPGGTGHVANRHTFPAAQNLSLVSLRMVPGSVREPHWHPDGTELNYVVAGEARLTVFSPDGEVDTFTLTRGQASTIPSGYFHHIENIGRDELHMTVFFSSSLPGDIGISGALSAYANDVLGASFDLDPKFFAALPKISEDVLVVRGGG